MRETCEWQVEKAGGLKLQSSLWERGRRKASVHWRKGWSMELPNSLSCRVWTLLKVFYAGHPEAARRSQTELRRVRGLKSGLGLAEEQACASR